MSLCRNGWFCTSTDADGSAPRHTANHFRSDSGKPNRANFNRDLKSISTLFQDREFFVFLSVSPFGYKSLLSSGKFSAMENEGLNAVGFWWTKTNLKKKKEIQKIMCFAFLCTSCDVCFGDLLRIQRDNYSKSVLSNQISSKLIFVTASGKGNQSCWTNNDHKEPLEHKKNNDKRNLTAA